VASNEGVTTIDSRGTVPIRTSDNSSSNTTMCFTPESSSKFSDRGRKTAVKITFSHTNFSISTVKPVTLYAILPPYCVEFSVVITYGWIPKVLTLMGKPMKFFGIFPGYKCAFSENLPLFSKTHSFSTMTFFTSPLIPNLNGNQLYKFSLSAAVVFVVLIACSG